MNKKLLFFVGVILALNSCDDVFEPALENNRDLETLLYDDPEFTEGLLYNAYRRIPTNAWSFSELATDDAVSSDENNTFSRVATGQWTSNFNPLDQWDNSRAAIQYINLFLSEVDQEVFSNDSVTNQMFRDRTKGEAYGLRALFTYHLLQAHAGLVDGELLGIPLLVNPEDPDSEFNLPRATFEQSMQQIYSDIDKAIELLPLDYADISANADVPDKYLELGAEFSDYNRAFGNFARLRMTERVALAIESKAALLAASPAFSQWSTTSWADAANAAAIVLELNGGLSGLAANGLTWYSNVDQINDLPQGTNPPEVLWRANLPAPSTDLEEMNYPPSLYGEGIVNPTQNLVNAFPMANGYPITDPASGYDPLNPYTGRDPRLSEFVVLNGSTLGPNNSVITTAIEGPIDGLNQVEASTRTGYYLRKLLRTDVNLNPTSVNAQRHIKPHIRYTEIFLNYAEAANEAWGPMGTGPFAPYSAYEVIRAIRERAGVGAGNGDPYLESIKNDQAAMRELIRNERRLELSFEGFRFWDLRRWDVNLTENAKGVLIANGNYEVIDVESRVFPDYMIYGPVPYSEILKYNALRQNTGW